VICLWCVDGQLRLRSELWVSVQQIYITTIAYGMLMTECAGLSWGAIIGVDVTDYVVVLHDYAAVRGIIGQRQVQPPPVQLQSRPLTKQSLHVIDNTDTHKILCTVYYQAYCYGPTFLMKCILLSIYRCRWAERRSSLWRGWAGPPPHRSS
jgi:hypothetical protein